MRAFLFASLMAFLALVIFSLTVILCIYVPLVGIPLAFVLLSLYFGSLATGYPYNKKEQ